MWNECERMGFSLMLRSLSFEGEEVLDLRNLTDLRWKLWKEVNYKMMAKMEFYLELRVNGLVKVEDVRTIIEKEKRLMKEAKEKEMKYEDPIERWVRQDGFDCTDLDCLTKLRRYERAWKKLKVRFGETLEGNNNTVRAFFLWEEEDNDDDRYFGKEGGRKEYMWNNRDRLHEVLAEITGYERYATEVELSNFLEVKEFKASRNLYIYICL